MAKVRRVFAQYLEAEAIFVYDDVSLEVLQLEIDELPGHRINVSVSDGLRSVSVERLKQTKRGTHVVSLPIAFKKMVERIERNDPVRLEFPGRISVEWTRKA